MEALWATTGPAKNLIELACRARGKLSVESTANISIATFVRGNRAASNDFIVACEKAGLDVHLIRERFAFDPAILGAIQELVDHWKPDIIQSHAVKSHFLVRLTGINKCRPWIAFHHGYTWTSPRTTLYNQLDRWSLPAATRVVTVCQQFAKAIMEIGVKPERITVLHNSVKPFSPVSEEEIVELRRHLGVDKNIAVVLCAGRLSREKAQADLIEAAALLRRAEGRLKIRFVLAGEGPDYKMLKEVARFRGVEDWFIFTGHLIHIAPYYKLANLLVLPSLTEGSPNVLLEGMAAGLPIIATNVGGVPEIVTHEKEALLVEKHDPAALAKAIMRTLNDENFRMRLADAALKQSKHYSASAYCDSMLAMYRKCLIPNDCESTP